MDSIEDATKRIQNVKPSLHRFIVVLFFHLTSTLVSIIAYIFHDSILYKKYSIDGVGLNT